MTPALSFRVIGERNLSLNRGMSFLPYALEIYWIARSRKTG
jgi:hypothetical protein